ncbi:hypothetical protein [Chamaesiphon sp. VAR_69_metabat_338]|uniref:hypothetical protein n=1 Tax=Chamaesiphon sp. VAR_69_metabat_338 TaxID=2964704 RepID=UPI00286DDF1D|nr:hypothetical protein [Chamaesiphon sp. VAR_69_metabat_338]
MNYERRSARWQYLDWQNRDDRKSKLKILAHLTVSLKFNALGYLGTASSLNSND